MAAGLGLLCFCVSSRVDSCLGDITPLFEPLPSLAYKETQNMTHFRVSQKDRLIKAWMIHFIADNLSDNKQTSYVTLFELLL